jgi:hypothetical protein
MDPHQDLPAYTGRRSNWLHSRLGGRHHQIKLDAVSRVLPRYFESSFLLSLDLKPSTSVRARTEQIEGWLRFAVARRNRGAAVTD